MVQTHRIQSLADARAFALARQYEKALRAVEKLLRRDPEDLDALRLKGNILDLEAADEELNFDDKLKALKVGRSRACYERILDLEPANVLALKDLGDSWLYDDPERALRYYDRAQQLVEAGRAVLPEDDSEDMLERRQEALELTWKGM